MTETEIRGCLLLQGDSHMKQLWFVLFIFVAEGQIWSAKDTNGTIDRHALVTRHNINLTDAVDRPVLQVGNGEIAFGVDATGLQTFYGNTFAMGLAYIAAPGWLACGRL